MGGQDLDWVPQLNVLMHDIKYTPTTKGIDFDAKKCIKECVN